MDRPCCISNTSCAISDAVQRLHSQDPHLKYIILGYPTYTDGRLAELLDCLLTHPNIIRGFYLNNSRLLTDKMGVKIARYIAASSTIRELSLVDNQFSDVTFLAIAAALRVNTSLEALFLYNNQKIDRNRVELAFIDALLLNPNRTSNSWWQLYSNRRTDVDFERLKKKAQELGHPSMQALLATKVFGILIE